MKYIDIFSGCGGLSLGLHKAGLRGVFAVEKNKDAFETLKNNLIENKKHFKAWPDWLEIKEHDITELITIHRNKLNDISGGIDLVVGGPPCQGFSMAGQRNSNDVRNLLVDYYIDFISIVRPKYLFFENVKGFITSKKNEDVYYKDYVEESLQSLGYHTKSKIIIMSDYGVPQKRERFILVGTLEENNDFFDKLLLNKNNFLIKKGITDFNSVHDAISDLLMENGVIESPDSKNFKAGIYSKPKSSYQKLMRKDIIDSNPDSHRFANHTQNIKKLHQEMIKSCEKGIRITPKDNLVDGLKRRGVTILNPNKQSPTVTSHPDDFIHYSEPRIPTVRELARLQSFPDDFVFKGKYTTGGKLRRIDVPRFTQVGNAIPPLFAELVGVVFKEMFYGKRKS